MTTSYFYSTGDDPDATPAPHTDDPAVMAMWLHENPAHLQSYTASMYRLADNLASWHAYSSMRDCLNFLVDVLVAVATLRGERWH